MIEITLTTFVDFVIASGTARITRVRKAKNQYNKGYYPAEDYWKRLRDTIIEMHQRGYPKNHLDKALKNIREHKASNYFNAVYSYKKWIGKKQIKWFKCQLVQPWIFGKLAVKVNPELNIMINEEKHIIKLYFKKQIISKQRIDAILRLIELTIPESCPNLIPCIIDVQRGKLHKPTRDINDIDSLLISEAVAFVTMWEHV